MGGPRLELGRQQDAAGALLGVGGDLGELDDISELVRMGELAATDGPSVGVEDRHQAVGDLLTGEAFGDLVCHLAGQGNDFGQGGDRLGARTPRDARSDRTGALGLGQELLGLSDGGLDLGGGFLGQALDVLFRLSAAAPQGTCHGAHAKPHRPGAVPDPGGDSRDSGDHLAPGSCEHPHSI